MKISTKGRYGLTVMIELSKNTNQKPISLKSIATKHDLSEHDLEQLVPSLRNAGLVQSIRAAYGGYTASAPADQCAAGRIARALVGPITIVEGREDEPQAQRALWIRIRDAVKDVLDSTTLDDLSKFKDNKATEPYMFYI